MNKNWKKNELTNLYYGLSPILLLVLITQLTYSPQFYSDMTIESPSTTGVGETFIISGTSRMAAAERVNLFLLNRKEPISYSIVGIKPPFVYEFEVKVSSNSLTINGIEFDTGPIAGKTIHVYVESNSQRFVASRVASITIEP